MCHSPLENISLVFCLIGSSLHAKDKITLTLTSLFFFILVMIRFSTHWTSKYNLLVVGLLLVYQHLIFFFYLLQLFFKSCCFERKRSFILKKKDKGVCSMQCIGSRSRPAVSCTHIDFLVCVGFWHCELHFDFFLHNKHIVLFSSKAVFQGRALPSGLIVNTVKL